MFIAKEGACEELCENPHQEGRGVHVLCDGSGERGLDVEVGRPSRGGLPVRPGQLADGRAGGLQHRDVRAVLLQGRGERLDGALCQHELPALRAGREGCKGLAGAGDGPRLGAERRERVDEGLDAAAFDRGALGFAPGARRAV